MKSDCACSGYSNRRGKQSVLVGESGSGKRWMVASSRAGGCAVARIWILRACRAVVSVCCSCCRRVAVCILVFSAAERTFSREWILDRSFEKDALRGSRVTPRVQASVASAILSRARRAREER